MQLQATKSVFHSASDQPHQSTVPTNTSHLPFRRQEAKWVLICPNVAFGLVSVYQEFCDRPLKQRDISSDAAESLRTLKVF